MKRDLQFNGWQDFVELGVASWIICSPFVLGYFHEASASLSIMMIGSVMILFAIMGLATEKPIDEWINLALGLFLIATPWIFGFSS
ncbi:MAG: SPW repeat protein, partial [Gammaproteobacteria bacterium]|nr:SPW repeat protein [Gammaproteobacteria bacterium]